MNKLYIRIGWENFPSEKTALNESNLNRMDLALDNIDNRVIEIDSTKVNKEVANNLVKTWSIDEETGIITVEHLDGSKDLFDLNIEKIPVNFELSDDGILTMTTDDGSKFTANIGAMIPVLTFEDSDEIAVSVSGEGVNKTYSFSIKAGSVTEDKLQPNFLADVKTEVAKAQASQSAAAESASAASGSATLAESYAHGGTGTRDGEDADNARYYMEQAKAVSAVNVATTEKAGIVKPDGDTITVDPDGTIHGQSKVDEMTGATADTDGTSGTVPAPKAGQENYVLKGNGAWEAIAYDSELSAESENAPQTKVVEAKTKEIEGNLNATNGNLSQLSNPNLLINPDFKINQRGGKIVESGKNYYSDESCGTLASTTTSAYTATKISNGNYSILIDSTTYYVKASDVVDGYCELGYTVDRWHITDTGVTLIKKNKGIHLSYSQRGQIHQKFEEELEGTFTLSAKFSDNDGVASNFEMQFFNSDGWVPNGFIATAETSGILKLTLTGKVIGVSLRAASANIEWVKLELGSVATPFVPPDPASELLKCQRYFQKHGCDLIPMTTKDGTISFRGSLYTQMRSIPSVFVNRSDLKLYQVVDNTEHTANISINSSILSKDGVGLIWCASDFAFTVGSDVHWNCNYDNTFYFDAEIY